MLLVVSIENQESRIKSKIKNLNLKEFEIEPRIQIENIDEIRNYLIVQINRNELMGKRHKKVCKVLNYTDHALIAISSILNVFPFQFLLLQLVFQQELRVLQFCVITEGIKKYKPIIKKN